MKRFIILLSVIILCFTLSKTAFAADPLNFPNLDDETVFKMRAVTRLDATPTNASQGHSNCTYEWYSATDAAGNGEQLINGESARTFTPSSDNEGTFYYFCRVTETVDDMRTADTNVMTLTVEVPDHVLTDGQELNLDNVNNGETINVSGAVRIYEDNEHSRKLLHAYSCIFFCHNPFKKIHYGSDI